MAGPGHDRVRPRARHGDKAFTVTEMTTVLIVEADANIRAGLTRSLAERGYDVRAASAGLGGLSIIVDERPDVVLLDLGLPDIDGVDLLRMIRAVSPVPVVAVTARDDESEIIRTLDAGADDYVVKPFSTRQLEARLRAVLRRTQEDQGTLAITVGALRIDPDTREAPREGGDQETAPRRSLGPTLRRKRQDRRRPHLVAPAQAR